MTSGDRVIGDPVAWDQPSPAAERIADLLRTVSPPGTLRLLLQRLALHERGAPAGEHEVIEAVTDVGGNLVTVPLLLRVDEDQRLREELDDAVRSLREELAAGGLDGVDALEVQIDADGERRVLLGLGLEISPEEIGQHPAHPAIHDGAHHIAYDAPALDELRDRVSAPPPRLLQRLWRRLRPQRD